MSRRTRSVTGVTNRPSTTALPGIRGRREGPWSDGKDDAGLDARREGLSSADGAPRRAAAAAGAAPPPADDGAGGSPHMSGTREIFSHFNGPPDMSFFKRIVEPVRARGGGANTASAGRV